jgi:fructose-bisphosphate aldolase class II
MNFKGYLKKAVKEGFAIGQFNISNFETLKAIIQAAEKLRSPVIIGTSEGESRFLGLEKAVALVSSFRKEKGMPVFLNLDHGKTLDYIKKAVNVGYDSVHFDGPEFSLDKNIEIAKELVRIAKVKGIVVEGDVGFVGKNLAEPEDVERFLKEVKVDSLAVSIGTWHGEGKKCGIDFTRLEEIKKRAKNVPLVLHGGSGVPGSHIKKAIKMGVAKININTELRLAYTRSVQKAASGEEIAPYKYMPEVISNIQKVVEEKIKLFGSSNKI